MLSDAAIYQRTDRGQRELLRADDFGVSPTLRVLARVNGFTDVRGLVDLSPDDASRLGAALEQLLEKGLIERVDPARTHH